MRGFEVGVPAEQERVQQEVVADGQVAQEGLGTDAERGGDLRSRGRHLRQRPPGDRVPPAIVERPLLARVGGEHPLDRGGAMNHPDDSPVAGNRLLPPAGVEHPLAEDRLVAIPERERLLGESRLRTWW